MRYSSTELQQYRVTVQRVTAVQSYSSTELQYRVTAVQSYSSTELQYSELQQYRVTAVQSYSSTELQQYRGTVQ